MTKNIIAPSILSADFGNLKRDIEMLNESQCGWLHLDVMDGVFVPNISFGFPVIKEIARYSKKPLDAHLMIVNPDAYIERFAELGVQYLSVHLEACTHLHRTVQKIKSCGVKAGVAINPHTSVSLLEDILPDLDFVLIMSVNPGFGGQSFIPQAEEKVKKLKQMIQRANADCLIEIDGGVGLDNAARLADAGVDVFVAGSSVFGAANPSETIARLASL
ncbi:MAG: ribulose-phosphate 3-epimerase [Bacteroidales bacterium]|nr:ribulose-phosphate 3-epimerase [Bacteroidales bacterium]